MRGSGFRDSGRGIRGLRVGEELDHDVDGRPARQNKDLRWCLASVI